MTKTPLSQHIRRFAADALLGLGLFFVAATLTVSNASYAGETLLEEVGDAAVKVADVSISSPALLMLAAVCSGLFAMNTAFFRHLRRAHTGAHRPVEVKTTEVRE